MANAFHAQEKVWVIDTADSTGILDVKAKVKKVRWVGATTAGHQAIIKDSGNNETIWESVASGANFIDSDLIESWWPRGFTVPTLDSGTLYIYLE